MATAVLMFMQSWSVNNNTTEHCPYFGTWNSYTTMNLHALEIGLVVHQMARDNPLHHSEYQDGLNLVHLFHTLG